MYRILIFNDSKWRDLPANVLLKYHLENSIPDCYVQIVSFHLWNEAIHLFNPHLVILNHILGKRNKSIASHVKRNGGNVAVLYTEGIVEFKGKEDVFRLQQDANHVDLFLCWNDVVADLVGGNAVVVGSPRFDFYTHPLKKLIDSRGLFCDKYNLNHDDPIIVCGDSWPSAKFSYSMRSFHRNDWRDLGNVKADKWEDPDKFAEYQFQAQEHFKFLLLSIRNEYPLMQVVVKSHPMSDYQRWSSWCKEHGITLVHGEYIFNVLNAADVYISKLGSITIPEAWLLDTPTITLGTEYDTASSEEQLFLSPNTDSVDGLHILIEDALVDELLIRDEEVNAYLTKWGMNKTDSANVVVDELVNLIYGKPPSPNLGSFQQAVFKHDIQFSKAKADPFGNYDKTVLQSDVREWQRRINGCL
ncbi:MAG: surface carbohydrate biosynthesis protein [Planctomycetota bacterium]|jgi:surface carbohydrate biosynthesis protein